MSGPRIYNPAQLGGDELEKSFVARQETLADLLRTIRVQAADSPCQHTLLIGPRGMGKTTMGLMCLRRVEQDPALAALWQPVPFHEESYGIGDLADLWLTALRHLAHATGDGQWAEKADALVADERDANRQAAYALAALLDFHQESGKRLLLFIENLDQVLAQIGDERQIHALRAALIQHPELLLLGSANTVFKAIRSHSHPFYEFFRLVFLRELDADETRLLLTAAAGERSREDFQDAIDAETGRLETIRRLTGGNPRLLKLACRMMLESPLGTALEDLERLIDEQTPYFKGRIEELPPQLRRVFHCLAEGWQPLLAKEVAATSKLSSSHASAQLRQLVEKGYAEEHRLPNSKRVYYQVVDRFYNIYYLLRLSHRSRGRFERLLQFLQDLFGVVSMRTMYETTLSELREGTATEERHDLISVLAEHVAGDQGFGRRAGWMRDAAEVAGDTIIDGWQRKGAKQLQGSQFEDAAETFGNILEYAEEEDAIASGSWPLVALVNRVASLLQLRKYDDVANDEYSHFAEAAHLGADAHTKHWAALYFLGCGMALEPLDRVAEAVDMWIRCADLIGVRDSSSLQAIAAYALFRVARSHVEQKQFGDTVTITRRAWEYDSTDVPTSIRRQMVVPLTISAIWLLIGSELDPRKTKSEQAADLAESERHARRAWTYNPKDRVVLHVLSDVLARQRRWEEALEHLEGAASRAGSVPALADSKFAESFIRALAAGHAGRVKEIMANTALAERMEPLWRATCAELGEDVGPLPAEVADAVAAVRTAVEAVRAELGHGRNGKRSRGASDRLLEL